MVLLGRTWSAHAPDPVGCEDGGYRSTISHQPGPDQPIPCPLFVHFALSRPPRPATRVVVLRLPRPAGHMSDPAAEVPVVATERQAELLCRLLLRHGAVEERRGQSPVQSRARRYAVLHAAVRRWSTPCRALRNSSPRSATVWRRPRSPSSAGHRPPLRPVGSARWAPTCHACGLRLPTTAALRALSHRPDDQLVDVDVGGLADRIGDRTSDGIGRDGRRAVSLHCRRGFWFGDGVGQFGLDDAR
jgi:hypothetical protein